MIEKIRNIFIEETTQQLELIEELLVVEKGDYSDSVVDEIFRAMHSIKGAGPMVGFNILPNVTMPVEKTYARIRKGELNISDELVQKTNSVVRLIINALESNSDMHLAEKNNEDELLIFFNNLSS